MVEYDIWYWFINFRYIFTRPGAGNQKWFLMGNYIIMHILTPNLNNSQKFTLLLCVCISSFFLKYLYFDAEVPTRQLINMVTSSSPFSRDQYRHSQSHANQYPLGIPPSPFCFYSIATPIIFPLYVYITIPRKISHFLTNLGSVVLQIKSDLLRLSIDFILYNQHQKYL